MPKKNENIKNVELKKCFKLANANKVTINPSKPNFFLITLKLNEQAPLIIKKILPILCKNINNLRVYIDSKLNFRSHIIDLEDKFS